MTALVLHLYNRLAGSIYCPGGRYCPDPLTNMPCKAGHFCKQGSSRMSACPALTHCPEGTETPTNNYIGFVLDGCLFLLLALMWHVSKVYNALMQRLNSRERVRVMWHKMAPQVCGIRPELQDALMHAVYGRTFCLPWQVQQGARARHMAQDCSTGVDLQARRASACSVRRRGLFRMHSCMLCVA
jgi:hypothetical protein